MRNLILLAATALAVGLTPAAATAKPDKAKAAKVHAGKAHAKGAKAHTATRRYTDINRNGVADWRERWIDHNRDGIDDRRQVGNRWGGAACPPGLAKKTPACIPPGQAKRMFAQGQRLPLNYRYYTDYDDIPLVLRDRYTLDDDFRYIYRDDRIYVVDPTTRLITRIIDAIL